MRPIDADEITATLEIAISMMENTKSIIGVENLPVIDVEIKAYTDILKGIKEQPTVQPEAQEGHWIPHETPDGGVQYECSRCGVLWEFNDGTPEDNEAYFCPKCGTKMIAK